MQFVQAGEQTLMFHVEHTHLNTCNLPFERDLTSLGAI